MTALVDEHPVKLWANSGDSHFIEPEDLWRSRLPKRLAELVPRSERDPDGKWESIHVDGQVFVYSDGHGVQRQLEEPGAHRHTGRG